MWHRTWCLDSWALYLNKKKIKTSFRVGFCLRAISGLVITLSFLGLSCRQCEAEEITAGSIVLLPLENRSGDAEAGIKAFEKARTFLEKEFKQSIQLEEAEKVDAFLAARRIRRTDSLSRRIARGVGKVLGADAVLGGAVELYNNSEIPQVGISFYMLNTLDGRRVWSNYASLDGRDFMGFFCQGSITSVDLLLARAISQVFQGLPMNIQVEERDLRPFHMVQAELFPPYVQGGQSCKIMVNFSSITEFPQKVQARFNGVIIPLQGEDGTIYETEFPSPHKSGFYDIEFFATDSNGDIFPFPSGTGIHVDNEPPSIDLISHINAFSPKNHKARNHVLFFPRLGNQDTISHWEFEILDEDGQRVKSAKGEGTLPNGLIWRGEGNNVAVVEPGRYHGIFTLTDKAGNQGQTSPVYVTIDTTPPRIEVDITQNEEKIWIFHIQVEEETDIKQWRLNVVNDKGKVRQEFYGEGMPPSALELTHEEAEEKKGEIQYYYRIEAIDIAGNLYRSSQNRLQCNASRKTEGDIKEPAQWDDQF